MDTVRNKVVNWESKDCYPELVRHATVANYTMNCFKIPSSILNQMDGVQRKFCWESGSSGRRMCLDKWSNICAPICGGGLGIRPLAHLNATFLTKLAWRMVSAPLPLLSRMFFGNYYRKGGWRNGGLTNSTSFCSDAWRGIQVGLMNLIGKVLLNIGSGAFVCIGLDPWCLSSQFGLPKLKLEFGHLASKHVSFLARSNGAGWNMGIINLIF